MKIRQTMDDLLEDPKKTKGLLYLCGASLIWAGWWVINRYGVTGGMHPYDIVAVRFSVAGIVLLPVLWRLGLGTKWYRALLLGLVGGLLNSMCAIYGVKFASASHGATLMPGMAPIFTALLAWLILNEHLSRVRWLGVILLLFGAVLIGARGFGVVGDEQWIGHLLFVAASLCWSTYIVCMRKWKIGAWQGTAIASVVSLIIYLPIYLYFFGGQMLQYPVESLLLQGLYQGILASVGAFALFNATIAIFGAAGAGAASALIPVFTVVLAAFFLGEIPNIYEIVGILAVVIGLPFAMGLISGRNRPDPIDDDISRAPANLGTKFDVKV